MGFNESVLDAEHIAKWMLAKGVESTGGGVVADAEALQAALVDRVRAGKEFREEDLADCNHCMGVSPMDLPECPFCTVPDDEEAEEPPTPAPAPAPALKKRKLVQPPAQQESLAVVDAEGVDSTPPAKAKKATKKKAKEPAQTPAPEAPKKAPKKAPKAKKAKVAKAATEVVDAALALAAEGGDVVVKSEIGLDAQLERIQQAQKRAGGALYQQAHALKVIFDNDLWKHRENNRGEAAYSGFRGFVQTEVGMTPQYAYRLIQVAKEFTEEQLLQYGPSRLQMALKLPKEVREKVLEAGDDIELAASADASTTVKQPRTAIVLVAGETELPMQATVRGIGRGIPTQDALDLDDEPWAEWELDNGAILRFEVRQTPDGVKLHITSMKPE